MTGGPGIPRYPLKTIGNSHSHFSQDAVSPSFCYLLRHCDTLQMCQACVSGPASGVDVDTCQRREEDECEVFTQATCDITEDNNFDIVYNIFVGTCQDMCRGNPACHWFTWQYISGLRGTCWFLDHCDGQERCEECVSGPAEGPDVDICI